MDAMPKNENLDIIFLIDRSGSMSGSEEDTIGGFNSYIEREKNKGFNTKVTTVLFDDKYELLYRRKDINEVEKLTDKQYWVRGMTALYDAIGKTINLLDKEIDNKVLFVIMTDGMENDSHEYSKQHITNLIENHNWEFIFIGADIDSYAEARQIGIRENRVANYQKSKRGVGKLYNAIENVTFCMRENLDLDDANWKEDLEEYD
ncbi:vWA domain-containing protein [Methanobrevibacter sp.]|uniref:vWA domain-containing protein n=1 Tax=Methanobrevibacter sp. TaxID=66852 RepID=UPI00388F4047